MILFMITSKLAEADEYTIWDVYRGDRITEENVKFISWNEARYEAKDGNRIKIDSVQHLMDAVYDAAIHDPICIDINHQFRDQYKYDIFANYKNPVDNKIVVDVFMSWPHPMIGNVLLSPGIRPQVCLDQYNKNWGSFPEKYMYRNTKIRIEEMINNPAKVGLLPLEKSGRDQVRICKDMTELARAVMGEISTCATKKLEKIYALELCGSEKLWEAQKQLIKAIIVARFEKVIISSKGGEKVIEGSFKDLFFKQDRQPITITQYIPFYFPGVTEISDRKMQWTVFVQLINWSLGEDSGLECIPADCRTKELLDKIEPQINKLPKTIRCAMIINAIKRFEKNYFIQRYSLCAANESDLVKHSEYVIPCIIVEASGRDFIPVLTEPQPEGKDVLLWNWMREENHLATKTYRHYLMPLWAGSSGHTAGLTEFYCRHLKSWTVMVKNEKGLEEVSIVAVIMSTMFTFWRLYYDKRICAVHTLAETFEGGYSFGLRENQKILDKNKEYIESLLSYDAYSIEHLEEESYEDPFDLINYLPLRVFNNFGVVNSVYIMAEIRKKQFKKLEKHENLGEILNGLDGILNDLRQILLAKGYEVPLWSKPLEKSPPSTAEATTGASSSGSGNVKVLSFEILGVKKFPKRSCVKNNLREAVLPSDRLLKLYEKISAVKKEYNFSEDFASLPQCIVSNENKPFLSAINFFNIQDIALHDDNFTFAATAETNADFWRSASEIISVKETETFLCTVSDNEEGFCFTGRVSVNFSYRITDKLSLNMKCIIIKSGFTEDLNFPQVSTVADISNGGDMLELMVTIPLGSSIMYISGKYGEGRVFTLARLLALFRIDEVIPVSSILPDDESLFGSLGLSEVSLAVDTNPVSITHIDFTITAEKPWDIFDNKITLQPYFEMNIEYPFESERKLIDYTVLGKWTIGTSVFDVMYRSSKVIKAELASDSVLNFAEVAEVFAKGVRFPEIKIVGMEMTADLVSKNYSLYLAAADVLKIDVGRTNIGIDDIVLSLDFLDGSFGDLALSGTLMLGGLTLSLSGSYSKGGVISFKAAAFSDTHLSLVDFAAQIAKDIDSSFDKAAFPEEFMEVGIRTFGVSYESEKREFVACVDLDHVLQLSDKFSIDELAMKISCSKIKPVEFVIMAQARICGTALSLSLTKEGGDFIIAGSAEFKNLTFQSVAEELGINISGVPEFIMEFAVTSLALQYNMTQKDFKITVVTSPGTIAAEIKAGTETGWMISYKVNPSVSADIQKMPLIGELVEKVSPGEHDLSVKDFEIDASSKNGVAFKCLVFSEEFQLDLYKPKKNISANADSKPMVKWIRLNKTVAVLNVPKVGIGLDKSVVMLLLDASLNVKPFSFSLTGAGVGINISKLSDVKFYLSGFGVVFDNGSVSVGGSFSVIENQGKTVYRGALLIKFKAISAAAIAEYSSGSLMAYFALCAPIGGPPAFFVTGLAFGFGYNKRLILPKVEAVPEYPLIAAATAGFSPGILEDFGEYIKDEGNQNFLTAGVKFTSFRLINGFLLLSVSFGNEFELGVLGIADVSIPPDVPTDPIAKAQLAIKADFRPLVGVLSVEARLTSESYILSRDCIITGGFASFFWFGKNEYSGDFVVSMGGYHPAFQKPDHYPVVPRLGLSWKIGSNLRISGELYFALTPSVLMAGGRLSAVYSQGNLNAWFIAYANFLISWLPFHYDITIGVTLGASYRIDRWFIHRTFSIEALADLHLWGPEVQGNAHISWFIISFTISFSTGPDHSGDTLDWTGFKNSFLLGTKDKGTNQEKSENDILTIGVEGIVGKAMDGTDIVDANTLQITLTSKIPESGNVRPVANALLTSKTAVEVAKRGGSSVKDKFIKSAVTENVPAALWKAAPTAAEKLREDPTVNNAVCGVSLKSNLKYPGLFPETRFISLDELYKNNTLKFGSSFHFISDQRMKLSNKESITAFSQMANSEAAKKRRQKFLADNGITEIISIGNLVKDAQGWFTEDILIKAENW